MNALAPWIAAAAIAAAALVLVLVLMAVLKAGRPLSENTSRLLLITITVIYTIVVVAGQRWTNLSMPLGLALFGAYALAQEARTARGRWGFWSLGLGLSGAIIALQCLDPRLDIWLLLIVGAFAVVLAVYAGYIARRLIALSRPDTSPPTETGTSA